jgi:hypothetical protein
VAKLSQNINGALEKYLYMAQTMLLASNVLSHVCGLNTGF